VLDSGLPASSPWIIERLTGDSQWRDSEFAVQVRLKSIWFQSNKSFGGCLEVEHVMVRQRDMSCPFDDDASEEPGF